MNAAFSGPECFKKLAFWLLIYIVPPHFHVINFSMVWAAFEENNVVDISIPGHDVFLKAYVKNFPAAILWIVKLYGGFRDKITHINGNFAIERAPSIYLT